MLWKTPKGRGSRLLLLDMDFFTNFVSNESPGNSWYESTGIAGDTWFFGNATPGFTIGGVIMLPNGYVSAARGVAGRIQAAPQQGWSIALTSANHLIVTYALDSGAFVVLDAGEVTVGIAWPFLIDIFVNGGGSVTGRVYIPQPGNLAHIAATNTAAGVVKYQPPTAFTPTFKLGVILPPFGANGVLINGLTNGVSITPGGLPASTVEIFFQNVKDTLTLPILDAVNPDRYVDATLVFPDAPLTYVTATPPASDLTQQNSPPSLTNTPRTVAFAY